MTTFETTSGRFNCRVAGVAIANEHVLLHTFVGEDYWTLPGGRPELMETASEALTRELQEETRLAVNVKRLLWLMENFFTYKGTPFHELLLCFEMEIVGPMPVTPDEFPGVEGDVNLIFRWWPLDDLQTLPLRPVFLRQALRDLPASTVHIVCRDE